MKQPRRFKATTTLGPEGRLMALGRAETPDPEAKQRVARRLGISASALASAAASATITTSANAAATSGANAVGSVGAALGKTTASFVGATLAKATLIGLSLGIASYAGVRAFTTESSEHVPSVKALRTITATPPRRATAAPGIATETSVSQVPAVEAGSAHAKVPSLASAGTLAATTAAAEATSSLAARARPVGRFDDDEPLAVLPSAVGAVTSSFTRQPAPADTSATRHVSTLPVDPRLAREVASLDLARASANRGDAAGALRELTSFERSYGYVALRCEAMLVHIDVLLSLGRRVEAAAISRQLLRLGAPATQRARLEELIRSQP